MKAKEKKKPRHEILLNDKRKGYNEKERGGKEEKKKRKNKKWKERKPQTFELLTKHYAIGTN